MKSILRSSPRCFAQLLIGVILPLLASGCMRTKFFKDADLEHETGLRVYTAKPYLLVMAPAGTPDTEKPPSAKGEGKDGEEGDQGDDGDGGEPEPTVAISPVQVIYLPDLAKPTYIKHSVGIGRVDLNLKLENGILTEYKHNADSTTAETIQAVGETIKNAADAYRTIVSPVSAAATEGDVERELEGVIENLNKLDEADPSFKLDINPLPESINPAPEVRPAPPGSSQKPLIDPVVPQPQKPADPSKSIWPLSRSVVPSLREMLNSIKAGRTRSRNHLPEMESLLRTLRSIRSRVTLSRANTIFLDTAIRRLAKAIRLTKQIAGETPLPEFQLYEIRIDPTGTRLIPVLVLPEDGETRVRQQQPSK